MEKLPSELVSASSIDSWSSTSRAGTSGTSLQPAEGLFGAQSPADGRSLANGVEAVEHGDDARAERHLVAGEAGRGGPSRRGALAELLDDLRVELARLAVQPANALGVAIEPLQNRER